MDQPPGCRSSDGTLRTRRRVPAELHAALGKFRSSRFASRRIRRSTGDGDGDPFGVDIAFGSKLVESPETIAGSDALSFIGIETPQHRVYPRSAHLAEKLHAYTRPPAAGQRENSRVKDLPDIALLATTPRGFDPVVLRAAIDATFAQRATHPVPTSFPSPPPSWKDRYAALAEENDLAWGDLDAVTAAARAFVEPILTAAPVTAWKRDEWRWT